MLLKSLPIEDYSNVTITLTNVPNTNLVEVEATLLEEERKIKARKGGFTHVNEEKALFTKK